MEISDIQSPIPEVLVTNTQHVLRICFNRPERKNALNLAIYSSLAQIIESAEKNTSVRVIVLSGANQCFTSGNDLLDFMNNPHVSEQHPVVRFMTALQQCVKPVVAVVEGYAVGIGTTLLLHCDLVYAAKDARLQLPFVNLGLCPEYASSYLVPRLVGPQKAAELLLLGEVFSGSVAQELGFVNAAVASEELWSYAEARIARLASQPPSAVRTAKKLLKASQQKAISSSIENEFVEFAKALVSDEAKESMTAFFEKRAPDFSKFN